MRLEHLRHAFFGQALKRARQMLLFHRIAEPYAAQDFRREIGNAREYDLARFRQRIADAQDAVIGNADDVTRPRLVDRLPFLGEEQDGIVHAERLAGAGLFELHAAPESPRTQSQERDPVAMVRVHIGLHLEHEARHFFVRRKHNARARGLRRGSRGKFRQSIHQFAHAEILERAAEKDRREMACAIRIQIEGLTAAAGQRRFFFELFVFVARQNVLQRRAGNAALAGLSGGSKSEKFVRSKS